MAEALDPGHQGGAAQVHFLGQGDQPVRKHLALIAAILLGKEGHLITVHDRSPAACDDAFSIARPGRQRAWRAMPLGSCLAQKSS
ncbi:hypothetical protein D3C78_1732320 [compost metagenome]